jgi:hypothetical protein
LGKAVQVISVWSMVADRHEKLSHNAAGCLIYASYCGRHTAIADVSDSLQLCSPVGADALHVPAVGMIDLMKQILCILIALAGTRKSLS